MPRSDAPPVPAGSPAVERGVGLFETVLLAGRRPVLWRQHIDRLLRSLTQFDLPAPSMEEIESATAAALENHDETGESALRLTWLAVGSDLENRGSWRLDAALRPIPPATLRRRAGSHAACLPAAFQRDMPGLKATSYLACVLGLRYALRRGCDEAFFVAADGSCIEGTATALLAWNGGGLMASEHLALPGVTAAALAGDTPPRGTLSRALLRRGAMVLGSLTKAAPVLTIDGEACLQPPAMRERIEAFNRSLTEGCFG